MGYLTGQRRPKPPTSRNSDADVRSDRFRTPLTQKSLKAIRRRLKGLSKDAVQAAVGGLALNPKNFINQLPLEALAHLVASSARHGRNEPTDRDLKAMVRLAQGLIPMAPDPPEQPFALPVIHGSAEAALPLGLIVGIDHEADTIFSLVSDFAGASADVAALDRRIEGLLGLLGGRMEAAGLRGVVAPGVSAPRAGLSMSGSRALSDAVRVTRGEMTAVFGESWRSEIAPLVSVGGEYDFDGSYGAISYRPLVGTAEGDLILAVPGMILPAIVRHATAVLAHARLEGLGAAYAAAVWADIDQSMAMMRIRSMPGDGGRSRGLVDYRLYRIDDEHAIAAVLIAADPFGGDNPIDDYAPTIAAAHEELTSLGSGNVALVLPHGPQEKHGFVGLEEPPEGTYDLLMTPSELSVLGRVEAGEPMSLLEFAAASTNVRRSVRVLSFAFLDEFQMYRSRESSYYLSDDGQPTMISIPPGSGLQLRLDAAVRGIQHVTESPLGEPVRLIPQWSAERGVYAPIGRLGQAARVVLSTPPIWVVGRPYSEGSDHEGWDSAVEAVAYWICELLPHVGENALGGSRVIVAVDGVDSWKSPDVLQVESPVEITIDRSSNVLIVRLTGRFAEDAQAPNNEADRGLLRALITGLQSIAGRHSSRPIDDLVDEIAPVGLKKMLLMIDLNRNPDIGPADVPSWRPVRDAPTGVVLDELGVRLKAKGWAATETASDSERLQILHDSVGIVFGMLEREVAEFDPELLQAMIACNESVIRERARRSLYDPPRRACFPEDPVDRRQSPIALDTSSIATRFLVEYVAARPPSGLRHPTPSAIDRLMALADVIIQRGHAADIEYLGLANTNARMLRSGRLGINDVAFRRIRAGLEPALSVERIREAESAFARRWNRGTGEGGIEDRIDRASMAEWGFTFTQMAGVIGGAAGVSLDMGVPVVTMPFTEAVAMISANAEIDNGLVMAILEALSLNPRQRFDRVDKPFDQTDVYPWRYNRQLSLLRRPFVRTQVEGASHLMFGRRTALECGYYTMDLLMTSRLRSRSSEMTKLKGHLSVERGKAFNQIVADDLRQRLDGPVLSAVRKVGPHRIADDIGDLDVVGVDSAHRVIWVVECKSLSRARTPHEISWELHDLLGGSAAEPGLLAKHLRRVAWVSDHLPEVVAHLEQSGTDWRVRSAFVVDEDLLGPYLRETASPVLTLDRFVDLLQEGKVAK